jgi:hypothetical protein
LIHDRVREGIFFISATAIRRVLESTYPRVQCVPGTLFPGIKRPGREFDHSPFSAEVTNAWSYTSNPPVRLHGVVLKQAMDTTLWHGT